MNTKILNKKIIVFCLTVLLGHCLIEVGNPTQEESKASLSVNGTKPGSLKILSSKKKPRETNAQNINVINSDATITGVIEISYAKIALNEITMKPSCLQASDELLNNSNNTNSYKFEGSFLADLLSNTLNPPIGEAIKIPKGESICELELNVFKINEENYFNFASIETEENENLIGNSLIIIGKYSGLIGTNKVNDIEFSLSSNLEKQFKLNNDTEDKAVFKIEKGINNIIIAFRLSKWFAFNTKEETSIYDFSDLEMENNKIILNEHSTGINEEIKNSIIENIIASADFGKDDNNDNILNIEEDDDPDDEDILDN